MNKYFRVFVTLFVVLNEEWKKFRDETLSIYLSEANPFLAENGSADPVVYKDFEKLCLDSKISPEDGFGYALALFYLDKLDPYYGDIKKWLLLVGKEAFAKKAKELSTLSLSEIEEMALK